MAGNGGRFKPGQSGNPGGKVIGQRRVLTAAFIKAVAEDFQKHGVSAIRRVRDEKPDKYLELCARLIEPQLLAGDAGGIVLKVMRYDVSEDDGGDHDTARLDAAGAPDPGVAGARLRH